MEGEYLRSHWGAGKESEQKGLKGRGCLANRDWGEEQGTPQFPRKKGGNTDKHGRKQGKDKEQQTEKTELGKK